MTTPTQLTHPNVSAMSITLKVLMPDNPTYTEAVEALKRYNEAEVAGIHGSELERLRLIAEHHFQAVVDYQLGALGVPTPVGH